MADKEHKAITELKARNEPLLINEVQLLLAEKRTYFALVRTSIAVTALPPTIVAFLVATREYHNFFDYFWSAYIVVTLLAVISLLGIFSSIRLWKKINRLNTYIQRIKDENKRLAEIIV